MQNLSETRVRRVVIAGGGTAGWMVAAGLSKILGKLLDIRLVESDEIGTVGVGEATIPTLVLFHRLLGINEQEFMAATQGTFKLGIGFESWRDLGENYIHSFGLTGKDHWTAGFQHFWLKGRDRKLATDYGDYCLELRASLEGRFSHLPRNGMNYAFHIDAGLYAKFLRKFAEGFGVKRIEGKIVDVKLDEASGNISSIKLDSGDLLEGDLFIDCTGFRGLLIGNALHVGYEDWSHHLFCDSAVALQTESVGPAIPYTRSIARSRLAMAHPAAASRRQRNGVLQPLSRRRCGQTRVVGQRRGQGAHRAARHQVPARPAPPDMETQLHRHRPVQRLHRAARIHEHSPYSARHHAAFADVPAQRYLSG